MSDEKTRAQYYQAHKDDPDEWGEPEPSPAPRKRRLASMISVRFSPDEARMVRLAAETVDESVSQFVRKATLQRCQPQRSQAPSITGTMQEIYRLQIDALDWKTLTDGGPDSREGSNWTPSVILAGSTTAKSST
jgi:uncharacterized protein (DUF1778 family)